MGETAERWKIEAVLTLVRQVEVCNFFIAGQHIPAGKTRLFLEKLSFDECDVLGIVQGLEVEDYSEGPLADDKGRCRDLWVFGAYVETFETYIKLAIYVTGEAVRSICVSFHAAEWPLFYPYRKAS